MRNPKRNKVDSNWGDKGLVISMELPKSAA